MRRERLERPVPKNLEALYGSLQSLPGVMMRESLRYLGLQASQADSVTDVARRVVAYVEDGKLAATTARAMTVECREYGGKRVYLYRATPRALRDWAWPDSRDVIDGLGDARIRRSSGPERLNYVLDNSTHIRISYSEVHTNLVIDRENLVIRPEPAQKVVVIAADRNTGDVALFIDPSGHKHRRGHRSIDYYAYWQARAGAILGIELVSLPLTIALGRLERANRVQIAHTRMRTAGGLLALTGIDTPDVREHSEWHSVSAGRIGYDEDEYIWLPQEAVPPASVGIPIRRVKTSIYAQPGEVRFMQYATQVEVAYVLEHLRSNA